MPLRKLLPLPLLIAMLALAACGSSDSGGSTGSTSTTGGASKAVADCRKEADKISDATAKQIALQGCDALKDGNVSKALSDAKKKCIDAANGIPVESLKESALKACAKIQE